MFNLDDYEHLRKNTIKHFKKKGYSRENVAEYSSLTGTPLVVIYEFIAQDLPENKKDCEEQIKFIKEYFKY